MPHAREGTIRAGQTALDAAQDAGTGLVAPCQGAGYCGKCVVRFLIHAPEPSAWDVLHLEPGAVEEGYRLACTARPAVDCIVSVPKQPSTIVLDDCQYPYRLSPPAQTAQITASDANVAEELRSVLPVVALRENPRGLTLRSTGSELRAVELGWNRADHLGVAVSVGTATIDGTLHDLRDGRALANTQVKLIGNTLLQGPNAATTTSAVRRLVRALCDDARVSPTGVADIIVLGMPPGGADDERMRSGGMGNSPMIDLAAAAAVACAPASEAPLLVLGLEPYP
nr:2Fe-2S iron-sulfur cluster-binding protein [Chloroflexota bacterium]